MRLRFLPAALLGAAALMSQLSQAGTPSSDQELGAVQAVVDFCSKADPKDQERIERQAKLILPDMTKARVAAARHSAKFQQAYQVVDSVLKGIALPEADHLCASSVPARETPPNRDDEGKKHEHEHEHDHEHR
jgi:hypothetical protein